tara:strand:- start:568 stop:1170 length:603 start_codon:yes stop_codon:yes gene_type:complete
MKGKQSVSLQHKQESKMTTTTEKTDIEQCEEWNIRQMCARVNGNKIYKVIVQQDQDYNKYQTSFIEDGFRNKTQVKDFYYGDGCGGNRHFGNEELFKHFSCFNQDSIEELANKHPNNRGSDVHVYRMKYRWMSVMPMRRVDITDYPTETSRGTFWKFPDYIPHHERVFEEIVHPDWEFVGKTTRGNKNNNIKLISITEMK